MDLSLYRVSEFSMSVVFKSFAGVLMSLIGVSLLWGMTVLLFLVYGIIVNFSDLDMESVLFLLRFAGYLILASISFFAMIKRLEEKSVCGFSPWGVVVFSSFLGCLASWQKSGALFLSLMVICLFSVLGLLFDKNFPENKNEMSPHEH